MGSFVSLIFRLVHLQSCLPQRHHRTRQRIRRHPTPTLGAWRLNPRKFECKNNPPAYANVNLGGVLPPSGRGLSEGRTSTASGSGRHLIMTEGHRIIRPGRQVYSVGHGPYTEAASHGGKTQGHVNGAGSHGGKTQGHAPWAASYGGKTQGLVPWAVSYGGKTQSHVPWAASHGGKTQGHVPWAASHRIMGLADHKLWWQDHTPGAASLGRQPHRFTSPAGSKLG